MDWIGDLSDGEILGRITAKAMQCNAVHFYIKGKKILGGSESKKSAV